MTESSFPTIDPSAIKCVVFDFGFTLCSDYYFNVVPPDYPQWHTFIQEHIFDQPAVVHAWMKGDLTLTDMALIVSQSIDMDVVSIVRIMEQGCEHLRFNMAIWNFAEAQRRIGRKTALVTGNMDVFTSVIVPSHGLDRLFDVILNTADYRELRKEVLWPLAFEQLGMGISYANSLLIDDGPTEPAIFRQLGGYAYQYSTDEAFLEWQRSAKWR